jgi:hypothetical protein
MRTTVNLDEDVLLAVRQIARDRGVALGKVLSHLVREAITRRPLCATRSGVPPFPVHPDAGVATLELVNRLRDGAP